MSKQKPTTNNNNIGNHYGSKTPLNSAKNITEHRASNQLMVENVQLVWIDSSIDTNNSDYQNNVKQLRRVINNINTFTNVDQCIQFLNNVGDENICMIVSDSLGQNIMPRIHDISQVYSILILSTDKKRHEQWIKEWSKINDVFTSISYICDALKQIAQDCERNAVPISLVATNEDISSKNLDHFDPSFIYSRILQDILVTIQFDQHHLKKFISYCRDAFADNDKELDNIKKFKEKYRNETPIWWYTNDSFLYPLLNRGFRTLDMEIIMKAGFFIGDLHRQIKQLHSEQRTGSRFTVYHGQGLSTLNFEQMKKTKDGLLSFNNFLFTNKDREIALDFARRTRKNPDLVGILFVMAIDPSKSTTPFASINNVSYHKGKQDEILFSIYTVFRIGDIKPLGKHQRFYQVDLTLVSDNDTDLNTCTNRIRQETFPDEKEWHRMGSLLLKTGRPDKVVQVHRILIKQTANDNEKATIYGQLGLAKSDQGVYQDAIVYYEKSLEIYKRNLPANYSQLASSYSNIGNVYYQMGECAKALSSYENALEIQQQILQPSHPDLGMSFANIALMFGKVGEYTKALSLYEKALDIQQQALPSNHPDLAASYNNIGAMYDELHNYPKALSFYENALTLRTQSLPSNHPDLGMSNINIGNVYQCMGDYAKALSFYEAGIKIQQQSLSPNHLDIASSYNKIGVLYDDMGLYSKALTSHEKALDMRLQSLPPNDPYLGESYNNIGNVYFNMDEYSKALSSYDKALQIRQKTLPPNHSGLGSSYNNIGAVYDKMEDYSKALSFYEKALAIRIQSLPPNHPDLASSYSNIGVVYDKLGEHEKALSSYEKGIQIQQQSLPPNHPDLASSYNNIGALYEDTRNYPQALSFYGKALEIRQQSLPPNHPDLGVSYNNIAEIYHYMKAYPKALSYYEQGLEIQQQTCPSNHPDLASSFNKLGAVYEDMRNYSKARSSYEHAVNIGQQSLPTDHPHLQMYKKNLDGVKKK